MTFILKPSRVLWLAVAVLAMLFIALGSAQNASAQGRGDSMLPPSKSEGCSKKFNAKDSETWVCVRMSGPSEVTENVPFKVTMKFKARKTLKNIKVTVNAPRGGKPLYQRKFKTLKKGRTIVRTVETVVTPSPSSSPASGRSASDNGPAYRVQSVGLGTTRDNSWLGTWTGFVYTQ